MCRESAFHSFGPSIEKPTFPNFVCTPGRRQSVTQNLWPASGMVKGSRSEERYPGPMVVRRKNIRGGQNFPEVMDMQYPGGRSCGKGEFRWGMVALIIFSYWDELQHNFQQRIFLKYRKEKKFQGGNAPLSPLADAYAWASAMQELEYRQGR